MPPIADVAGVEFTVAGMTRGDHLRRRGTPGVGLGVEHSSLTLPRDPRRPWGLGSESTAVASPLAGAHPVEPDTFGWVNYGGTAGGDWRFAFWGRTITGLRVSHGGPVTLRPGDIVVSHARPWGPNGFADSPFAAAAFKPLRITHGAVTVGISGCATHFYNVDRYECHVVGGFTFDADNIPDHVAVNRFFAPQPTTPPPRATAGSQPTDPDPTTCTTTPNTACQPTS